MPKNWIYFYTTPKNWYFIHIEYCVYSLDVAENNLISLLRVVERKRKHLIMHRYHKYILQTLATKYIHTQWHRIVRLNYRCWRTWKKPKPKAKLLEKLRTHFFLRNEDIIRDLKYHLIIWAFKHLSIWAFVLSNFFWALEPNYISCSLIIVRERTQPTSQLQKKTTETDRKRDSIL